LQRLRRRLFSECRLCHTPDAFSGTGEIHIATRGLGPEDGFTGYEAFDSGSPTARWGDYRAAVRAFLPATGARISKVKP
jgi:hypothetical protein